jgi:glycosyltransferase involved in cell wall biosynthesis
LILRDFFPQWAIEQGLIAERSPVAYYFKMFERLNYSSSDVIAVQSDANVDVFNAMVGTHDYRVEVLYNWTLSNMIAEAQFGFEFCKRLKINDKFIFFYGGNLGFSQDIPYILKLASKFSKVPEVHFLIVGQGDQFNDIEAAIEQLKLRNVTLSSSVSQKDYESLLLNVDVGVFTLAAEHTAHNFPGKILSYLSAGLPILGAVNPGNDLIALVNERHAGFVSVNGELDQLFSDALRLYQEQELRQKMAVAAKDLLLNMFSVQSAADQILNSYELRGD